MPADIAIIRRKVLKQYEDLSAHAMNIRDQEGKALIQGYGGMVPGTGKPWHWIRMGSAENRMSVLFSGDHILLSDDTSLAFTVSWAKYEVGTTVTFFYEYG